MAGSDSVCFEEKDRELCKEPLLFHFVQMPTLASSLGLRAAPRRYSHIEVRIWASFPAPAMVMRKIRTLGTDLKTLSVAAEQDLEVI